MTSPNNADDDGEKPLDPAAERVRRKLVRFVGVNLAILFLAVAVVLAAVVWRAGIFGGGPAGGDNAAVPSGEPLLEGVIALPAGARINQHSLSGDRVSFDATLAEGSRVLLVYDLRQRRIVARFALISE